MKRSVVVLPVCVAGALAANPPATGLNQFAATTYQQLAPSPGNLIFSPFSISTALSMLLAGARGSTATEITGVIHQMVPASLMDQLTKAANTGGNELSVANGLWLQAGFPVLAGFKDTLATEYKAPPEQVHFATALEQARARINSWTDQHTKGKIRDLFAPGVLGTDTRLVLTSAIYFDGKWESPFQAEKTLPEPFHTTPNVSVEADFMHQKAEFGYAETPLAQVLEMKYAGIPIVLDVILPRNGTSLASVEKALTPNLLSDSFGKLQRMDVDVAIPKFRADSSFSLRDTLSLMGMASAFDTTADFSGIDGRRDLRVSDVVHKAFVDVSEKGTVAAAATGVGIALMAMREGRTPVFRADHPFAFFIRDTRSGAILFAGRLVSPK